MANPLLCFKRNVQLEIQVISDTTPVFHITTVVLRDVWCILSVKQHVHCGDLPRTVHSKSYQQWRVRTNFELHGHNRLSFQIRQSLNYSVTPSRHCYQRLGIGPRDTLRQQLQLKLERAGYNILRLSHSMTLIHTLVKPILLIGVLKQLLAVGYIRTEVIAQ